MTHIIRHPRKSKLAYVEHKGSLQPIFYLTGGVSKRILSTSFNLLDDLLSRWSKVTVIFLQLHQNSYTPNNAKFSLFLKKLKRSLEKVYRSKTAHIWVRERSTSLAQHYHLAIFLNGHKCRKSYRIDELARGIWEELEEHNFSYQVKNRLYHIRRSYDDRELEAARTRLSYLAKKITKEKTKSGRSFHHSGSRFRAS